jgi:hypothetical protein
MKTLRYNIYSKVHKQTRTMLLDAGIKMQRTDFSKPEEVRKTITGIRQVIVSFENHIKTEETLILHPLASITPYMVALVERTNQKNLLQARSIGRQLDQYAQLRTYTERLSYGMDLQVAFFEFTAAVLQQMNKEQTVINDLLWANYSDEQLMAIEAARVQKSAPQESLIYIRQARESNGTAPKWLAKVIENAVPAWNVIRGHFNGPQAA